MLVDTSLVAAKAKKTSKPVAEKKSPSAKKLSSSTGKRSALPHESASALIDARIQDLGDWRGETLAKMRRLIRQADPEVVEEWKWGVPVWSHGGILCTGETYKAAVKLTFARGAALDDPKGVFNSSLEGRVRRAIDLREGEKLNEAAFKALVRAAVSLNLTR